MILSTERLLACNFAADDLESLAAQYRTLMVRRNISEGRHTQKGTREELVWYCQGQPQPKNLEMWTALFKGTGQFSEHTSLLPQVINGEYGE